MLDYLFQSPFVVLFKKKRIVENQIYLAVVGIFSALCKFEVVTSIYACLTQPPIVIFLFVYMNYKSQEMFGNGKSLLCISEPGNV